MAKKGQYKFTKKDKLYWVILGGAWFYYLNKYEDNITVVLLLLILLAVVGMIIFQCLAADNNKQHNFTFRKTHTNDVATELFTLEIKDTLALIPHQNIKIIASLNKEHSDETYQITADKITWMEDLEWRGSVYVCEETVIHTLDKPGYMGRSGEEELFIRLVYELAAGWKIELAHSYELEEAFKSYVKDTIEKIGNDPSSYYLEKLRRVEKLLKL